MRVHASVSSSASVTPAGDGYSVTISPSSPLRIMNASPIGIWNADHASSSSTKSSSHSDPPPVARYSGSPECSDQQVEHTQTMRRSTRLSRCWWRSLRPTGHSSQWPSRAVRLRRSGVLGQRHLDLAARAQQRDRLELQVAVALAARARQVVGAAARRAGQRPADQHPARQRRRAARAPVAVGEQRAGHVGDHQAARRRGLARGPGRRAAPPTPATRPAGARAARPPRPRRPSRRGRARRRAGRSRPPPPASRTTPRSRRRSPAAAGARRRPRCPAARCRRRGTRGTGRTSSSASRTRSSSGTG